MRSYIDISRKTECLGLSIPELPTVGEEDRCGIWC
jgi:hypothetical protein